MKLKRLVETKQTPGLLTPMQLRQTLYGKIILEKFLSGEDIVRSDIRKRSRRGAGTFSRVGSGIESHEWVAEDETQFLSGSDHHLADKERFRIIDDLLYNKYKQIFDSEYQNYKEKCLKLETEDERVNVISELINSIREKIARETNLKELKELVHSELAKKTKDTSFQSDSNQYQELVKIQGVEKKNALAALICVRKYLVDNGLDVSLADRIKEFIIGVNK